MCILSLVLNTFVIKKHYPRKKKVASLIFCILALTDMIKCICSLFYAYNMVKKDIDVFSNVNIISFKMFHYVVVIISTRTSVSLTTFLCIHRFISIKWPARNVTHATFLCFFVMFEIYFIATFVYYFIVGRPYFWAVWVQGVFRSDYSKAKYLVWLWTLPIMLCAAISLILAASIVILLQKQIIRAVGNTKLIRQGAITVVLLSVSTVVTVLAWFSITIVATNWNILIDWIATKKILLFLLEKYTLLIDSLLNPLILVVRTSRSIKVDSILSTTSNRLASIAQSLGDALNKRSSTALSRVRDPTKSCVESADRVIINSTFVERKGTSV